MTFPHLFKTAVLGLKTNKLRSALTMLGIVIGITAIMVVMAIGKGAEQLIVDQVQGLGSKTIIVIPGREPKGPADAAQIFSDSLKERDLGLLQKKTNVPTLARIMPILFGGETGAYKGETYRLTIFGASPLISEIFELFPKEGRFFSDAEVRSQSSVAIIGSKVKDELFGDANALGEKIKIKGRNFRVIGVLPKKGQVSFFNFDETAIVPYTTAGQYIFGIKYFHRFIIEANNDDNIPRTVRDIELTLRNSHGIDDPDKDDFFVETQADLVERLGVITNTLTIFLAAMAAISLVVGGIGIMNIMLVSVTERTHEIGLRKALGAREEDILRQFLLEAVMLTVLGGFVGILLGTVLSFGIAIILTQIVGLDWQFNFPLLAMFLGLGVAGLVGIVFGYYPARTAAKKSPIEALRYE
jgi:putative ABC transport system permease protein